MSDLPFLWIFVGVASIVDLVGLFYLWRRRKSPSESNHTPFRHSGPLFLGERRRRERRRTGSATRSA